MAGRGFKSPRVRKGGRVERRAGKAARSRRRITGPAVGLLLLAGCNPVYVIRLGWAESRILRSRVPLTEVMADPDTEPGERGKLRLAWDARRHAIDELGFENAGDSYTSLARLESDTLALVLTAAYRDRLELRTWWFPVAGRIPYRAYFSVEGAEEARDALEREGFDTYLRPTAAFSTLGWFADPLYSTMLIADEVGVVETVLHELAHNHLYLPGRGRFNESYANFAGHVAAIHFFCRDQADDLPTVRCRRARARWADAQDISRYIDGLEREVVELLSSAAGPASPGNPGSPAGSTLLAARDSLYRAARDDFVSRVQPSLRATTYGYLAAEPLNNATLLSRSLYYHRLPDFDALWRATGKDLAGLLAWMRDTAPGLDDPFGILDGEPPSGPAQD